MSLNRQPFMNTYIDNVTKQEAIAHIEYCIKNQIIGQVITPNVDQIVRMEWDDKFKKICEDCELLLVDGHPLIWTAKLYNRPFKEKICGSDLVPELCKIAAQKGYSVFFLGAAPGVAQQAVDNLKEKYPSLNVVGCYSPPFGFEKDKAEIANINKMLLDSKADMLFVGMGVPKQDIFIHENMRKYQIPMSFSIGATIDFIAGVQKRAPKWMQDIGMEWFYRLISDPRRMFKRYVIDDSKYLYLIWKYRKVGGKS